MTGINFTETIETDLGSSGAIAVAIGGSAPVSVIATLLLSFQNTPPIGGTSPVNVAATAVLSAFDLITGSAPVAVAATAIIFDEDMIAGSAPVIVSAGAYLTVRVPIFG